MTISRMQQSRQMYGLGSFVKKIAKGVKGAVKGVKKFAKSDLGKAALLLGGGYYLGGGNLLGLQRAGMTGFSPANLPGIGSLFSQNGKDGLIKRGIDTLGLGVAPGEKPTFGQMAKVFGIGTLGGAAIDALTAGGVEPGQVKDIETLKMELANGYKLLNPGVGQKEVDDFVRNNIPVQNKAYGGRIGYAFGNDPEQNAIQASGIMGLPLNENPAGATELDLRETGGFIPPVGVKEKEDDIPAMLSNNEFVFTADAVRGMGDGDVNMGAQRMYDMMKKLENGGRV